MNIWLFNFDSSVRAQHEKYREKCETQVSYTANYNLRRRRVYANSFTAEFKNGIARQARASGVANLLDSRNAHSRLISSIGVFAQLSAPVNLAQMK